MKIVEYIFSSNIKTTTKKIKLLIADYIKSMEVRRMRPKPKMNPLDKRIKPNPKYSKVFFILFFFSTCSVVLFSLKGGTYNKHWK